VETAEPRRRTPYQTWQEAEGVPIYRGSFISDLYHLDVAPWARVGQRGAIVNLAEQEEDDAWLIEIAAGGETVTLHHLFESTVYILEGRGATSFSQEGGRKQTVEWQRGSVFSVPLNVSYRHFNLDGQNAARLFMVTNAPMLMNTFRNPGFVFEDDYAFWDRYGGEDDYFSDPGQAIQTRLWKTNYIPDIRGFELEDHSYRGEGDRSMRFRLANNQMECHVSEFPPGVYKKAHRHGPGAHVVILSGVGYSLLWFEGEEPLKVDWADGSVVSPKSMEYHQHFNSGQTPARYLALRLGDLDTKTRAGGWYTTEELEGIPYEREDPKIYALYREECAKHGAKVVLDHPLAAMPR
jgi:quercetin dioxygenase-like cupin family protein